MAPPSHPAPDEPHTGGVVLRLPAAVGQPVRIARPHLAEALSAVADVEAVAFTDDPAEAAVLAHALAARLDAPAGNSESGGQDGGGQDIGGLAVLAPVVDALKRVAGDAVRETVDRSTLARAVAPAIVRADVLRAAIRDLTDVPGAVVHPVALVARTHRILPLAR